MENEIIIVMPAKLGDGLLSLPVASWLARNRKCKIHWVLAGGFGPFNYLAPLLMLQPMTARVSVVPHKYDNYNCGGQPKDYLPAHYGLAGEHYCLGFRGYPDRYVPAYYASEFGFGYDLDYRIDLGNPLPKTDEILRSTEGAMAKLVPHAMPMGTHEDLLTLARRMAAAKEVHLWFCGLGILCFLARIPAVVHRVPGHAYIPLYYEGDYRHITFCEHVAEEVK